MIIKKLPNGSHQKVGYYDKAKRWQPNDELRVEGAFNVRSPSRNYPYSYINHYYTLKFARLLFQEKPDLYMYLQNVNEFSRLVYQKCMEEN